MFDLFKLVNCCSASVGFGFVTLASVSCVHWFSLYGGINLFIQILIYRDINSQILYIY